MSATATPPDGSKAVAGVVGTVLVVVGGLWLLSEVLGFDVWAIGWPFFIIIPGAILVVFGLASGSPRGAGAAIPGMMALIAGLLLLYQTTTGHWESWVYAWALIAPGGVGLALWLVGLRSNDEEMRTGGRTTFIVGIGLFAAGFVIFDLLIGISGRHYGSWGGVVVALLLVGAGTYLIFSRD
jgi:hypothetical protein